MPSRATILVRCGVLLLLLLVTRSNALAQSPVQPARFPFVLDMVHHNPGEERFDSVFLDPDRLHQWGYTGTVLRESVQASVLFDSFDPAIFPLQSKERQWVAQNATRIENQIDAMKARGLGVYAFTDLIVLPKSLIEKYKSEICNEKGQIDIARPATEKILRAMLAEIMDRFPKLDGLVVRHGETYLNDLPHHGGGNPILRGVEDHVKLCDILRDELCIKRGKTLIYRTWDLRPAGLHNNPQYYLDVSNRIEPHEKLLFSMKHQWGDFHRMSKFNECIGIGKHRQIIEVQCQMEAYGKGAYPYYIGDGVINGWEEYAPMNPPRGLRDLLKNDRVAGVWTWSRGGGWRGPYIKNEFWCELNAYVVSRWAIDPSRSEEDVFNEFAKNIAALKGADDIARFRELAMLSAAAAVRAQNSFVHKMPVWWNRDEFYSDQTEECRKIVRENKAEPFLKEKQEARQMWEKIEALSKQIQFPDAKLADFVQVSATYGRIKCAIIEQMFRAMLLHEQAKPQDENALKEIAQAIAQYDQLWTEWRQLQADHPDVCATIYTDKAFMNRPGMGAAINALRR